MRHARAYSSSCLQVILVYLHPFRRSTLFCSRKLQKKSLKTLIWGTRSFSVDSAKKHVTSASYDKQHVCAYLQLFSC